MPPFNPARIVGRDDNRAMADEAKDGRGLGTGPMLLIGGAAFVLTMAGLQQVGNIVGPVFLALTLAITVRPVTHWFAERGAPGWVGTVAVLLILYVALLGMVFALGASIAQLATTLPDYSDRFTELYQQALGQLTHLGVSTTALSNIQDQFNFSSILGVLQTLLGQVQSVTTGLLFVLLSLAFLVLDTADLSARTAALHKARPHLVDAISDFAWRVRRYWLFSAIFGVILAVGDWIALVVLGIPFPLTWAVVAFICNFIPNIGFVVAVIPPALLALLTHGPREAILVLIAYVLISFVVQTLLLPKFMGDAVGLNTTTTFVSLVFWAGIIGGLGAVLAIPLTLFVKAVVIDSTPRLAWLGSFLSTDAAVRHGGVRPVTPSVTLRRPRRDRADRAR
jgi:predicted PurR-regulated permease PerM